MHKKSIDHSIGENRAATLLQIRMLVVTAGCHSSIQSGGRSLCHGVRLKHGWPGMIARRKQLSHDYDQEVALACRCDL